MARERGASYCRPPLPLPLPLQFNSIPFDSIQFNSLFCRSFTSSAAVTSHARQFAIDWTGSSGVSSPKVRACLAGLLVILRCTMRTALLLQNRQNCQQTADCERSFNSRLGCATNHLRSSKPDRFSSARTRLRVVCAVLSIALH